MKELILKVDELRRGVTRTPDVMIHMYHDEVRFVFQWIVGDKNPSWSHCLNLMELEFSKFDIVESVFNKADDHINNFMSRD